LKSILAIDDDIEIRHLLQKHLSNNYQLLSTDNAEAGMSMAQEKRPDLIILDLELPGVSGYEFCNQFRNHPFLNDTPIIILSSKKGSSAHTMAYKLGADNYLEKPFDLGELLAMIEAIFKRSKTQTKKLIGNLEVDLTSHSVTISNKTIDLTPKEFKILNFLIAHEGEVVSRDRLLNIVWGEANVTDRVVDNHITSIRKKIFEGKIKIESIYAEGYKLTADN